MARKAHFIKYRGYDLAESFLRVDIWHSGEWVEAKHGDDALAQAKKEIDGWMEAK